MTQSEIVEMIAQWKEEYTLDFIARSLVMALSPEQVEELVSLTYKHYESYKEANPTH